MLISADMSVSDSIKYLINLIIYVCTRSRVPLFNSYAVLLLIFVHTFFGLQQLNRFQLLFEAFLYSWQSKWIIIIIKKLYAFKKSHKICVFISFVQICEFCFRLIIIANNCVPKKQINYNCTEEGNTRFVIWYTNHCNWKRLFSKSVQQSKLLLIRIRQWNTCSSIVHFWFS